MADTAYRTMLESKRNQSMLITGESGAGKTENTKKVIQYLAHIAGRGGTEGKLEKKLLQANPLLEALGNAKTTKNNNSSRFGKFIKITFDKSGYISGASIVSYLLEKSRVVHQGKDERSFHIFYQMMAGMTNEEKRKYHLTVPEDFGFLNHSGCTSVRYMDDKKEYEHTRNALNILNFNEEDQHILFSVCAAICHLGNLPFEKESKSSDNCVINDKTSLEFAAELLQIDPVRLETSLIKPKIKVGGGKEVVQKHLDVVKASASRDALVKALYGRMFLWVVDKINKTLTVEPRDTFIGLLDIAGFEIFVHNSFEQLCINFTNEKLQQFFNHHMFTLEQEEYKREKIEWTWVDFGVDSQATIDLLEKKPNGIFPLLDEESVFPNATDQTFVNKLDKAHKGRHPKYFKDALGKSNVFIIRHYAGEVEYDTTAWLEKNRDPLETDLEVTINSSRSKLLTSFFSEFALNRSATELAGGRQAAAKKGAQFNTVGGAYKEQLGELMATLEATYPHFIRCILPNRDQVANKIDDDIVLMQLRCNGVLEGIRIQRQGYPNRMVYVNFLKRYYLIAPNVPRRASDTKAASKAIIDYLVAQNVVDQSQVQYGLTKIFFRVGELAKIEEAREKKIAAIIGSIQDASRGYVCRKLYKKTRERAIAGRVIQRNIRAWLDFKNWPWFLLYLKARQIAKRRNVEKEIEDRDAKIKDLQGNLDSLTKAKDQLSGDISSIKNKLETSEQQLREERLKANELEATNAELTGEQKKYKETLVDLQQEIQDLESQLGSANDRSTSLDKDLKDLEDQTEALVKEKNALEQIKLKQEEDIKELQAVLNAERDAVSDLRRVRTKFEEQVEDLSLNLDTELAAKDQLSKNRRQLESEIDAVNIKLDDENFKAEKLSKDFKQLQVDFKTLEDDLAVRGSELAKLNDANKQLSIELSDVKENLDKETKNRTGVEKSKKRLDEEVVALNEDLKNHGRRTTDLEKNLKKVLEELDETKFQLEDARSLIETLQGRSALSGEEVTKLQEELEQIRAKLKQVDAQKTNVENDLADFKDKLDIELRNNSGIARDKRSFEDELAKLKIKLDDEKRKNVTASKNEARLKGKETDLQSKLDAELSKKRETESKCRTLENEITDLELEIQSEKKLRDRMEQGRKDLDQKLIKLQVQFQDLEAFRNQNERASKDLQVEIEQLEHKLNDAKDEVEAQNLEKRKEEDRIDELETKIDSFDSERSSLKKEQHDLFGQIKNLQSDVESAETKAASLLKDNRKLLIEIDDLRAKIEDANRDAQRAEKMKRDSENDLFDVKDAIDNTGELILRTSEALKISGKEIGKLREVNEELADKLIQMAKKMKHQTGAL
eukprot:TRINITY_DN1350_c0_g6_i2.p1 TRINITY_DN1350_c0_g6~~TRINITY_DN1350_c0_g6_i2.p1  ORF type:complete len:1534 (-),score=398.22 TRINITY_DN1350_c0_g6_i2:47-4093(-)